MMYLSKILLSCLLLTFGCQATKLQTVKKESKICGYSVYFSLGLTPSVDGLLKDRGFERLVLINQRNIDGRKEGTLDVEVLQSAVLRNMPDPNSTQTVTLDWEGSVMDAIIAGKDKDPAAYKKATTLYQRAYRVVKDMRPNATVGFYGFPIRNYHHRNEAWKNKNRALDDFFSQFDALFPSIYDFYAGGETTKRWKRDVDYARENTEEALAMGQRINKPVYPYIWHRYHPSNKEKGRDLIKEPEFRSHLEAIVKAEMNGKTVDGIVWWGSEYSQFAKENRKKIERKLIRSTWEAEANKLLPVYANYITDILSEKCAD